MALSDERIAQIGVAHGLGCRVTDSGYPHDMLWFDGNPTPFARAIEAEVRKECDPLIRQMLAALEDINSADIDFSDEVSAARAWLEGAALSRQRPADHTVAHLRTLIELLNRRPALNAGLATAYSHWTSEVYDAMGAMHTPSANDGEAA